MSIVSISQVRNHLHTIVGRFGENHKAVNPNNTYGGGACIYAVVNEGVLTPVCIVGQFFASIGALSALVNDPSALVGRWASETEPEQAATCHVEADMWEQVERRTDISFPDEVRQYLRDAQLAQDGGRTWGKSLLFADDMLMWRAANDAAERAGIHSTPDQPRVESDRYADPVTVEDCQEALAPVNDDGLAEWERELLAADSPF